jgi:hypothetical protein
MWVFDGLGRSMGGSTVLHFDQHPRLTTTDPHQHTQRLSPQYNTRLPVHPIILLSFSIDPCA